MKNKLIILVLLVLGVLSARGQGASTCPYVYMEDNQFMYQGALFDLYRLDRDYANARRVLGVIGEMTDCTDLDFAVETEDFINLQHVLLDVEAGVISAEDAVEENEALVVSIAHTESYAGQVSAQLLLADAGVEPYYEVVRLPEPVLETKSAAINDTRVSRLNTPLGNIVNIYPNPTNGQITIEYALVDGFNNQCIHIYGSNGMLVDIIPLKQAAGMVNYNKRLPAGSYIIKIGDLFAGQVSVY